MVRELVPPALWRALSRITAARERRARRGGPVYGAEQPASYYDRTFLGKKHWTRHYTASRYYPLWTVIADRVGRRGARQVLDIGCGPGQVAALLRDRGVRQYTGLDFSPARIRQARKVCPEYRFVVADVHASDLLETAPYDLVLAMEFLEHVERDLEVLRRVRPGTPVLATVPNVPGVAHVRHFTSVRQVVDRYGGVLDELEVTPLLADAFGKTYFILEGVRH